MSCALITGCAKRIGKTIALNLAQQGYDIAIHYNSSPQKAHSLQSQIQSLGQTSQIYQADLSSNQDFLTLLPKVKADFPALNLLINNASVFQPATLKKTEIELFDLNFNVNFKAPYFLSRDFARLCLEGNIINLLDTRVKKNNFDYSAYTLAKKALANLTQMAALELAPNIRVNGICPGWILAPEQATEEYLEKLRQRIPLHKQGNPEQIVQAVNYLLSNQFVTGQLLMVNGGEHL